MQEETEIHKTVVHLFRHESGKMTAVLSKLLGLHHLETAQDIVQDTLLQALHTWGFKGVPENPSAWLYRTAKNKAVDYLRRQQTFNQISPKYLYQLQSENATSPNVDGIFEEDQIQDSQLQMIFACCHPNIPVESQMALALKTLCGLSASEISKAFLISEETITRRIYRAKEKLRAEEIALEMPLPAQIPIRLDAVLHCLYLLFNEGYNSSHASWLIREDLCEEATRLCYVLTQNSHTAVPRTFALLALFCFQASRLQARLDDWGQIVLLKHQDRTLWYKPLIDKGLSFLNKATQQETSTYHLEAAIAYLHAIAPSFEQTDWKAVYTLYSILYKQNASPFIAMNKAIAATYAVGSETGLNELHQVKGLENYYLYHTALGEACFDCGRIEEAQHHYQTALRLTASLAEQQLLHTKLQRCFQTT